MKLRTYVPRPPLSDYVDVLWLDEGNAPAHAANGASRWDGGTGGLTTTACCSARAGHVRRW